MLAQLFQMCPKCGDAHHGCREASSVTEEDASYLCGLSSRSPELLSFSTMSEISSPIFVYTRRKLRGSSAAILSVHHPDSMAKCQEESLYSISSGSLSVSIKEHHATPHDGRETEGARASVLHRGECSRGCQLKSGSVNGCAFGEVIGSDEASKSSKQKCIEVDSINDSCSSSKSNMELVSDSMRGVDDICECSSSSVTVVEVMGADALEKDRCVSILKSQGLLEGAFSGRTTASTEFDNTGGSSTSRSCKICACEEFAQKMLVCDNCEEAFHVSCCNPRVRRIPRDEWFCHSCLKKRKILMETVSWRSPNIMAESRCKNLSSTGESSPIASMLTDKEPYITGVRVGKGFQAEVPEWSGPINNDVDKIGEPLEIEQSEFLHLRKLKPSRPSELGCIGNWLQCRDVIDDAGNGAGGTTCGKWRRAPLFELQTEDWGCCSAVLWDPIHADCAVPQELETEQVLKQLKYIQMLRPRITAKRQRLDRTKNSDSFQNTDQGNINSEEAGR